MATKFDPDKYRKIFEDRHGPGSFESGMSKARAAGKAKADSEFAKFSYEQRLKEAEKAAKEAEKAAKQRAKDEAKKAKEALKKDEAQRKARGAELNKKMKAGKLTVEDMESTPKDRWTAIPSSTKGAHDGKKLTSSSALRQKHATAFDTYFKNETKKAISKNSKPKTKSKKKKNSNVLDDLFEVAKDAFQVNVLKQDPKKVTAKTVQSYKKKNKDISPATKELSRGVVRATDSATLGAVKELSKKTKNAKTADDLFFNEREIGKGGVTDMVTSGLGYLAPGVGAYKALNATKAGKVLTKVGSKSTAKRLGSEAVKGATVGGALSGAEVGIRESLNPDDYSARDNLKHIGLGVATGAIADPAIYGLGKLASPLASRIARNWKRGDKVQTPNGEAEVIGTSIPKVGDKSPVVRVQTAEGRIEEFKPEMLALPAPKTRGPLEQFTQPKGLVDPRPTFSPEVQNRMTASAVRNDDFVGFGQRSRPTQARPLRTTSATPRETNFNTRLQQVQDDMMNLRNIQSRVRDEVSPEIDGLLRQEADLRTQFVNERMGDVDAQMSKITQAESQWKAVQQLQQEAKRVKKAYGTIYVPEGNQTDWLEAVPPRFRAGKNNSGQAYDIYRAAEEEGFNSVDEFVQYLQQLDQATKTKKTDLTPEGEAISPQRYNELSDSMNMAFDETDAARGLQTLRSNLENEVNRLDNPDDLYSRVRQSSDPHSLDELINLREGQVNQYSEPISPAEPTLNDLLRRDPRVNQVLDSLTPQQQAQAQPSRSTLDDLMKQLEGSVQDAYASGSIDANPTRPRADIPAQPTRTEEPQAPVMDETSGVREGQPMGARAGTIDSYENSPIARRKTLVDKVKEGKVNKDTFIQGVKQNYISDLQVAKDIERKITEIDTDGKLAMTPDGKSVSSTNSLYKGLRSARRSSAKANYLIEESYAPILKSLDDAKINRQDFEEFLLAKHAEDILKNNTDKLQASKAVENELIKIEDQMETGQLQPEEYANLEKRHRDLVKLKDDLAPYQLPEQATPEWTQSTLDRWVNNSVINEAQQRWVQEQAKDLDMLADAGIYTADQVKAMKDAHPNYISMVRELDDVDPLFGVGNIAKPKKQIKSRKLGSENKILSPIDSAIKNRFLSVANAEKNKALQKIQALAEVEGQEFFKQVPQWIEPEQLQNMSVIKYFKDGNTTYYEVPQTFRNMVENLNNRDVDQGITKAIQATNQLIKKGATHYNPEFMIRSLLRDPQTSILTSRTNATPMDFAKGFLDAFTGKGFKEDFVKQGGKMAGLITVDEQSIAKATKAMQKGTLPSKAKIYTFGMLEKFGEAVEMTPRLAEYRAAKRKGYSDQDAAFEAVDAIDYSDAGTITRKGNKYIPYLNAAVRGNARLLQAAKENPKAFLGKGAVYITLPTIGMYAAREQFSTEEQKSKYKHLQDWERNMYFHLPNPDGENLLAFPKAHVAAQMFANPMERIMDVAYGNDTTSMSSEVKQSIKELATSLIPPTGIAGYQQLIEAATNHNFFMDMPIEAGYDMQNAKPSERHNSYTSEVAKGISGGIMNVTGEQELISPARVDHVLRGVTGSMGSNALDLIDSLLKGTGQADRPAGSETTSDIVNPLNTFSRPSTRGSGIIDRVYDQNQRNKWDGIEDPDFDAVYEEIREIAKEIKAVREDKDLTAKEKKEQLTELRKIERSAADNALDLLTR